MEPEKLTVSVSEEQKVTALLYSASKANRIGTTIILGHGAGANQLHHFMVHFARGLAGRGLDALTFNFLYKELGRGAPDPGLKLESCYGAVMNTALTNKKLKGNRLVIGGKSMGGRIASQVAAQDDSQIAALVFLGYPLHPPGKPEQLRDQHLKKIKSPMLFVQGTRDAFGTPEELRRTIKSLKLPATLYLIDGGDHSFKVPKSAGVSQDQVYESVMDKILEFVREKVK